MFKDSLKYPKKISKFFYKILKIFSINGSFNVVTTYFVQLEQTLLVMVLLIKAQGKMVDTGSKGKNPVRHRCLAPLFGIFERNLC